MGKVLPGLSTLFAVSAAEGALPSLYAATAPENAGKGGGGFGPNELNVCFTGAWKASGKAATPENAARLLDDTLKLIAAKGGKLPA